MAYTLGSKRTWIAFRCSGGRFSVVFVCGKTQDYPADTPIASVFLAPIKKAPSR